MARQNRAEVFDPSEVTVMHCVNRAVRRAMLCGRDPISGQSFEHRREWVRRRLVFLAANYGIDVLGYAVMGNHLHVILRNRPDVVRQWSDEDVARRIWNLFPKRREDDGSPAEPRQHELDMLTASRELVDRYRRRLSDVSWLMRQLAEHIARRANREDQCTGRFWEGRFKSQPLLDDAALLACSAYVDLNPVRAGIAETPEQSDFTSIQDRIVSQQSRPGRGTKSKRRRSKQSRSKPARRDNWLAPVYANPRGEPGPKPSRSGRRASDLGYLSIPWQAYLKLVDWTGRQLVRGKRGRIPKRCEPILKRLGLDRETWCELVGNFGRLFRRVAGRPDSLATSAQQTGIAHHRSRGGPALLAGT